MKIYTFCVRAFLLYKVNYLNKNSNFYLKLNKNTINPIDLHTTNHKQNYANLIKLIKKTLTESSKLNKN